jgi:UDP-N-acetylmuramate dehydrogenase
VARTLVHVRSEADVRRVVDHPVHGVAPKFILGGGSNVVLTRDVEAVVLKVEVGPPLVEQTATHCLDRRAGAGESWHGLVAWTVATAGPGWRTWR